jgi:formylglycine-generating enzyme required for sulfatase activity
MEVTAVEGSTIRDVIMAVVSGKVEGDVHIGDKIYYRSDLEELNDYLKKAVLAFESQMYQTLRHPARSDYPYKSVQPFAIEDSRIFFGRTNAIKELHTKVVRNRMTVVYARSGAGKTSLLNAGLSPILIEEARLPLCVHIRPYEENPVRAVKLAIVSASMGPWPKLLSELSLHDFLGLVCTHLSRDTLELVVIFDQFEQFRVSLPEPTVRLPFIKVLGDCYDDETLPVRFVIALREEYLSYLGELEPCIPQVFGNLYQLSPMTQEDVKEAILGPIVAKQKDVSIEPALLETLLNKLATKDTELAHVQIVCAKLYDSLPAGEKVITLSLYKSLGEVEEIITNYLDDTLSVLDEYEQIAARCILKALVGSEATNRILHFTELLRFIPPDVKQVENVLRYLIDRRLLRQDDTLEGKEYELAHAYLAAKIHHWIGQDELESRRAQELLQRELASYRVHETIIDEEKLNILREHIKYLILDTESQQLLFHSALEQGHDVTFWLEQLPDRQDGLEAIGARLVFVDRHLLDKILADLTARLQPPLRESFVAFVWSLYKKPRSLPEKQNLADALWAFGPQVTTKGRLQILPVVSLGWARRRKQLVTMGAVVVILLSALAGIILTRERAILGRWVTIPAGEFVMGMDQEEREFAFNLCKVMEEVAEGEKSRCTSLEDLVLESGSQKDAYLPAYQIMENEVTNAQYQQCIDEKVCTAPGNWHYEAGAMNEPAAKLNWHRAGEYCAWLGGRLPTAGEWEKAARGPDNHRFPWGDDWDKSKANLRRLGVDTVQSIDVYAKTDVSGYGVRNMAGNIQEWTASLSLPLEPEQVFSNEVFEWDDETINMPVIVRGGSWMNEPAQGMAAKRGTHGTIIVDPRRENFETLGFRCVCPEVGTCREPWTRSWSWSWIWKSIGRDK